MHDCDQRRPENWPSMSGRGGVLRADHEQRTNHQITGEPMKFLTLPIGLETILTMA